MNAICLTQSSSLDMFYYLMQAINDSIPLNKIGFYVADSRFFKQFIQKCPEIEMGNFSLLKEWEIVRESVDLKPDFSVLERYEKEIGQPYLWNALVADRRIYLGKKFAYAQDYQPRFSHEKMLAILQVGLERMENLFDEVKPNFIVFFQCNTLGEYLSYLFAKARNIQILNLRPTRIKNYIYAGESILEPSERLTKTYKQFLDDGIDSSVRDEALKYLQDAQSLHAKYEGVVPTSSKPPRIRNIRKTIKSLLNVRGVIRFLSGEYKFHFGEYRFDNHISGFIGPLINQRISRPWRSRLMNRRLRRTYIKSNDLSQLNYAFFPLHTEPEVTLNVYSKPYLNQIEAIRLFSHNLPVGMKLLVKEHPWSIGKRSFVYYRKLLEIPNVLLAHPELNSRELISNARIITAIAGSMGFESLILKKPAVVLGRIPFSILPSSMIRHATDPDHLGNEICDLLENYEYNEEALLSYISAVIQNSVPVDYYSKLLRRKGVFTMDGDKDDQKAREEERLKHIFRLAQYIGYRLENIN